MIIYKIDTDLYFGHKSP